MPFLTDSASSAFLFASMPRSKSSTIGSRPPRTFSAAFLIMSPFSLTVRLRKLSNSARRNRYSFFSFSRAALASSSFLLSSSISLASASISCSCSAATVSSAISMTLSSMPTPSLAFSGSEMLECFLLFLLIACCLLLRCCDYRLQQKPCLNGRRSVPL